MSRARSRLRRTLVVLGAVALPAALFAVGYVVTGAGAATAPTDPTAPTAAPVTDGLAAQRAFYAKLPNRIGIVGPDGKPIGWADKAALTPPSAGGTFDPATENAWNDKLVPVQDDGGNLIGYYLHGYGFVDRATAESPAFDRNALRQQRAAVAPAPPDAAGTTPAGP
jgi:hypothetical protein